MSEESTHLRLRELCSDDYEPLAQLMDDIFSDLGGAWSRGIIRQLMQLFPEGQMCIEDNGRLVAGALTIRVSYERFSNPHCYDDLITDYRVEAHVPDGDALYGLDVFVHPDYRGMRLGRRLYEARRDLCRDLNLRSILAGGRLPGFGPYMDRLSAEGTASDAQRPDRNATKESPLKVNGSARKGGDVKHASDYIELVKRQKLYDPILSFQLSNDFDVKRLLRRYLPEDEKSRGYATLLEWDNILYEPPQEGAYPRSTSARIGILQRRMHAVRSLEDLLEQVEFFIDAMSGYRADFAVLPEFFCAPLMGLKPNLSSVEAIALLAEYSQDLRVAMSDLAVSYNINIIAGSMPVRDGEELYNIAYLCRRDGTIEEQRKIHITPSERRDWNIVGGKQFQVFETDAGRIAILTCYDVEFPELGRLAAKQGAEILFVPFWTDTKNGYLRVHHCAQARAIENECYVAIAGSVGNLPRVDSVDIQYAQSGVFTPSDFYFPHDGILNEAVANTEMLLFADVDLEKLKLLHQEGSVTNLRDRRTDLYRLGWKAD